MAIFNDFRCSLKGAPGLHAFIAGVSAYSHFPNGDGKLAANSFGLDQLTTTASAAWDFYRWLLQRADKLPCPLATVRVLLSPSEAELATKPDMRPAMPCTRQEFAMNIRRWRTDALVDTSGFTLFYFAGHGVQRSPGDSLILMQDFANPDEGLMTRAAQIDDIWYGMAPGTGISDETPRSQLYIVDACRDKPTGFPSKMTVLNVWDDDLPAGVDNRSAPIFAPVSGASAFERAGKETFFTRAIMKCLEGAGGVALDQPGGTPPRWAVTLFSLSEALFSLSEALAYETDELKRNEGIELNWTCRGQLRNMPLHYLDGPPSVDVSVEVTPVEAVPVVRLRVLDEATTAVVYDRQPVRPHPDAIIARRILSRGGERGRRHEVHSRGPQGAAAAALPVTSPSEPMTALSFSLDPALMKVAGPEVPVEVARPDMVLVGSTTSKVPLDVPPGEYFVTAQLPGIESVTQRVVVEKGQANAEVHLAARASAPPREVATAREPGLYGFVQRYGWDVPTSFVRGSLVPIRLRILQGNIFGPENLEPAPVSSWDTEKEGAQVKVTIPPYAQPSIAQLLFLGLPPINVVLPIAAEVGCWLLVRRRVPTPVVECSIQHPQANLLLSLRHSGHLAAAEAMLGSPELTGERLLFEKNRDPIAAAVGAYTLLRMGSLEALHDWTQNLMERFPKLPDGAVLRGEHLARLGHHTEAANALCEVRRRGLPIFLDGLLFLSSRLEFYARSRKIVDRSCAAAMRDFRQQLQDIMPFVDRRCTFSSFIGLDPKHPDETALLYPRERGAAPIT